MDEVDAVAVVCKTSENVVITTGETGESSPPSGAGLGGELGKDEAFVPTKDEKEAERNCGSEEAGSKIRKRGSIGDGDNRVADQDQGSKGGTTDHPQRRNGCVDGKGVLYLYEREDKRKSAFQECEESGETGDYRKLPPLRDKDELEETAESGLRYYLKNEGCADDGVESVMEWA
ncbi:hypothetical protein PC112_g19854 [Phytophthora cactorum]|nr:hypothetical protein PC112_g19854 [Phytophthora cactorum]